MAHPSPTLPTPRVLPRAIRAALACGLLGASTGWAQTAPTTGGVATLPAVPVTAEAAPTGDTPQPPYAGGQVARGGRVGLLGNVDNADIPFSVTSYTSELIENQQARTLADVLKNNPAVQSSLAYGNFAEVFLIRGFQVAGEDFSFGGLYGVLPRQVTATPLAERVDVLFGPSAFLNGVPPTGGIGGTINIEPKRAGDTPLTRVGVDYASDSELGASIDMGRRFGDDKEFGVRVNALQRSGDSATDHEDKRMTFGSVGLDYRGERFRTSLDVGYQRYIVHQGRSVTYLGSGLTAVPEAPDASTNAAPPWSFTDLQTSFGALRGEYDLADDWTAYAAIGTNRNNEDGVYASPTVSALDGTASTSRLSVPYRSTAWGSAVGLRGKLRSGPVSHAINVGYSGNYLRTASAYDLGARSATNIYQPIYSPLPPSTFAGGNYDSPSTRSRSRMHGLSASDTLGFLDDRVLLTVGLRRQSINVQGYDYNANLTDTYDQAVTSPVVGIVFKPWTGVSLYANHIEGLQQGPTAPTSAVNAGQIFAPYKAKQNEIGVKYDAGALGASVALYEIKLPAGLTDPNTLIYSIDGEARHRGVEFNVYGEPMRGLRLIGGLSLYDAELSRTAGGTNDGNDAIGVPKYQATASVEYDIPGVAGLTAAGYVIRTGSQFANAANTLGVKPWTRLDLGLRYATKVNGYKVVYRANVENVADKDYWASANGGYLIQGQARTFKLSATMDF